MWINSHTSQPNKQRIQQIINTGKYNSARQQLDLSFLGEDWALVLGSRDWGKLRSLMLWSCGVVDGQLWRVFGLEWPNLQKLWLWNNKLTGSGLKTMLTTKMDKLTELILSQNNIGSMGVKILVKLDLPLLGQLWISQCNIGNIGLVYLAKGIWNNLRILRIDGNNIGLTGYLAMPSLGYWPNLSQIPMDWNQDVPIGLLEFVSNINKVIGNCEMAGTLMQIMRVRFCYDDHIC